MQQFSNNYSAPKAGQPSRGINVPFVNLTKSRGTGIPFVDFDANNPKPAPAPVGLTTNDINWNQVFGTPAPAPTTTSDGNYYDGGGGGGYSAPAAPTSDPNAVAYWNAQQAVLQGQLGQLDPSEQIGMGNLQRSYNDANSNLGLQFGRAERDYNTGVTDTQQGYSQARDAAASNARARLSSLQRLLGIAGSGNSSASMDAVPYSVAREGTEQLAPVQQTYGRNRRNQDVAFGDTKQDYTRGQGELATQLGQGQNSLKQSIATQRATLLDQIMNAGTQAGIAGGQNYAQAQTAQGPLQTQINDLLAQITQLGKTYENPNMSTNNVAYAAPQMGTYLPGAAGGVIDNRPGADNIDPTFLSLLTGRRAEDEQLI